MNVQNSVLAIIETGRVDGFRYYLPDQLDRKTYLQVNKALVALGGAWDRREKCHLFPTDLPLEDAITNLVTTGEVIDARAELDYFWTPLPLAQQLVEMAEVEEGDLCLEPGAGEKGFIALALAEAAGAKSRVCTVDVYPPFVAALQQAGFSWVHQADFLTWDSDWYDGFDRIVMNPPFSKQQDIDHVIKAISLLAPGGVLVAVMSPGTIWRTTRKAMAFRDMLQDYTHEFSTLPPKSFKAAGTNVETIALTLWM